MESLLKVRNINKEIKIKGKKKKCLVKKKGKTYRSIWGKKGM